MVNISTKKTIYSKEINKVMDTTPTAFIPTPTSTEPVQSIPTVDEFFEYYDILFYQIPSDGTNSHTTLVEKSSKYLGLDLNILLQQLQQLEEQNKQLQTQIQEINK